MLSESSYLTAIYVYVGMACAMLLCLLWWLRRRSPGWVALLLLLGAALLLTPAYPREGATTMAPALVVAAFQLMTEGYAAAQHALRPLGLTTVVAVLLAALLRLTLLRSRPASPAPQSETASQSESAPRAATAKRA